jgi:maleate isomerase
MVADSHSQPVRSPLRIGIATPQANPTAEPEIASLFPAGVHLLATRCVSAGDSRERLLNYFERLPEWLDSFGGLRLAAFGFACTASSYLLEAGREENACKELTERYGYPVITATAAIEAVLRLDGVTRLAVASPYPNWIHELSVAYWRGRGFEIVAESSAVPEMGDTKAIYDLDPRPVEKRFLDGLREHSAERVLLTGSGLPSLNMLPRLSQALGVPVVSSNLCLARACLQAAGVADGFSTFVE